MDLQSPSPQGLDILLKKAFGYWSRTLFYQLVFSLVYFSVFFIVWFAVAQRYGLLDDFISVFGNRDANITEMQTAFQAIVKKPEYYNLSLATVFVMSFLFPLNMGFFQIYRKMDLNEKFGIEDLFVGYNGLNFFKFSSYFLFWIFVYQYTMITIVLGVAWVFVTMFVAPLMFFMNQRIFEAINLNFKAIKLYPLEIVICVIVAVLFRYSGMLIFLFGILFTFPFWNAIIYTLYSKIFAEKESENQLQ